MSIQVLWLSLILSLSGVSLVQAMHEADHRYTISGYVRDDQGKPKEGVAVLLEHKESQQKHKVETNWWGYYEAVFHIHSTNVDGEIIVTAGSEVKKHKITFDPKDTVTERHGKLDFGAPEADSGVRWIYGVIGGTIFGGSAFYFYKRSRGHKKEAKHRGKKQRRDRHG